MDNGIHTLGENNVILLNKCVEGVLLELCNIGCRYDSRSCEQAIGHVLEGRHG